MIFRFVIFSFFAICSLASYTFKNEPIDVVIPCHEKDRETLEMCIEHIRKNGEGVRRVIVISNNKLTDRAEWFDENRYPFSKKAVLKEIKGVKSRFGWIYQQLLKLYAPFVIPNITSNVLVLDADTVFLKKVSFMNEKGEPYFTWGKENHKPYFEHAKRLLPDFRRQDRSGITHHMLFQRPILEDLFREIETVHGIEPWKAILRCIDPNELKGASFSEYEIYFHYVFMKTKKAHLRKLNWKNIYSLKKLNRYKCKQFDYVSCHKYMNSY